MTTPKLSIEVSKCSKTKRELGRLYVLFGVDTFKPKIRYATGCKGVYDGLLFPSITNIISVMGTDFQGWAKYMMGEYIQDNFDGTNLYDVVKKGSEANEQYTEFAGNRGTEVHKAIEDYIQTGKHDDFEYDGERYFEAWEKFQADFAPEYLKLEATVYGTTSSDDGYAGTIDAICRIGDKVYALDWKTSRYIHAEVGIQLSAGIKATEVVNDDYTALEPMLHVDGAMGIHLKPDGTYGVHVVNDIEHCWQTFEVLRQAWNWKAFGGAYHSEPLTEITSPAEL